MSEGRMKKNNWRNKIQGVRTEQSQVLFKVGHTGSVKDVKDPAASSDSLNTVVAKVQANRLQANRLRANRLRANRLGVSVSVADTEELKSCN